MFFDGISKNPIFLNFIGGKGKYMNIKTIIAILSIMLISIPFINAEPCGTVISSTTTLTGDVNCSAGTGLYINASGIVLDCAGYKIYKQASGSAQSGISIGAGYDNIEIKNCDIYGFDKSFDNYYFGYAPCTDNQNIYIHDINVYGYPFGAVTQNGLSLGEMFFTQPSMCGAGETKLNGAVFEDMNFYDVAYHSFYPCKNCVFDRIFSNCSGVYSADCVLAFFYDNDLQNVTLNHFTIPDTVDDNYGHSWFFSSSSSLNGGNDKSLQEVYLYNSNIDLSLDSGGNGDYGYPLLIAGDGLDATLNNVTVTSNNDSLVILWETLDCAIAGTNDGCDVVYNDVFAGTGASENVLADALSYTRSYSSHFSTNQIGTQIDGTSDLDTFSETMTTNSLSIGLVEYTINGNSYATNSPYSITSTYVSDSTSISNVLATSRSTFDLTFVDEGTIIEEANLSIDFLNLLLPIVIMGAMVLYFMRQFKKGR